MCAQVYSASALLLLQLVHLGICTIDGDADVAAACRACTWASEAYVGVRSIRLSGLHVLDYRPRVRMHKIKLLFGCDLCCVYRVRILIWRVVGLS